ncbi:MAG: Transcriptional regulator [Edaphobacter sp.]|nr:Transcriptional regulator [Edaphobacter sp.]
MRHALLELAVCIRCIPLTRPFPVACLLGLTRIHPRSGSGIVRIAGMCAMHLQSVDLNLLLPLQALLEERNVTRAGKRVHLSQSAMSRAFERLRETLGDELLIRSEGRYRLTARGITLLRELDLLLPRLEALWSGEAFSPRVTTSKVRLAMTDMAAALLLPPLTRDLARTAPGLRLQIVSWHEQSYEDLMTGRVDLVFSPLAAPSPLHMELLFDERFVCLIGQAHPFGGNAFLLKQYLGQSHIAVETQTGQQTLVDRPLAEAGYRRKIGLEVPFFIPGVMALENTELVLTCPQRLAKQMLSRFRVRRVKSPAEIPGFRYSMIWHPRLHEEELHAWFRRLAQQTCNVHFSSSV